MMLFVGAVFLWQFHAAAGGYLIDSWDSEKGLPDNFVTSVTQTPDGYLWVGTYNGLARFDGSRFVVFKPESTPQLGHARIVKLFLDAQGTLWINTYDGSLTSWRNGVFTREWSGNGENVSEAWLVAGGPREMMFAFRSGLLIRRPAATGAARDWQILKPPGNPPGAFYCQDCEGLTWCSTLDGNLWRITAGRFELVPKDAGLRGHEIHWLAPDLYGRLWVGTEKEIAVWDGRRFLDRTPGGATNLNVVSFSFATNGAVLIAADGRLRKFRDGKWAGEFKPWPDLMQEEELQATLYSDREGGWWRVSRGLGIFHIGPAGVSEQITVTNGLPGNHTTCWLEDQEGNFWVGVGNGGLVRLRPNHFEVIGMPGRPPGNAAMSVCEDQTGAVWMGTYGGGLNRWKNGLLMHFSIPAQSPGDFVFSIYPAAPGQLWISAGMEDLFIFRDGQVKSPRIAVHAVKSILVDRQNRVWMGRKDGVDCWAEGRLREWNSHNHSIAGPVRALAEDRRAVIWAGADDGNIYRFDVDGFQTIPLPDFPTHKAVWCLLPDADGTLWVGTIESGLLHFEAGRFTRFTSQDGLPDDMICQILDDQRGDLWLGTHHGICRVSKAALHDFASGKTAAIACSLYDRSDGLPALQCSGMYQPAAWRGHDGKLWFATAKGVVGVQPAEMPVNSRTPPVAIEEFLLDGKIQTPAEGGASPGVFKVPPGGRNFEFHYTALSLTDSDKMQFRYQLEGFDAGWINAGSRRWVQYNYLKPGGYRFRVVACNSDGLWNETGSSIRLQVRPHFWETWWFPVLLALGIISGVAGIARYVSHRAWRRELEKIEHQRDLEKDRARIARDIHDHIGSGLTRINLLNELRLGEPADQLANRAGQITRVTCELMQAMDEIVWAVNPKNDTLESLASYLCDFAEDYLRAAKIRLRLNVPAPLPAWPLASELRHNLFLATKEILNNIVKHSGAGKVVFELKPAPGAVILVIQDDGRGFAEDNAGGRPSSEWHRAGGNGLENLRKRAATIGGCCRISSEPGKGTRIEMVVPVAATKGKR